MMILSCVLSWAIRQSESGVTELGSAKPQSSLCVGKDICSSFSCGELL